MNNRISKIPEYFKLDKLRNDKRIVVFLVCLLIATGLWFLNALSKEYSTTISYPVKYVNPPSKQFLANMPPSKLELKVDAHGFTLLRHKLSLSFSPIILNLTNITKNLAEQDGTYTIPSSSLLRRIRSQVSNEITILEISPEVIPIVLDSLKSKTVPVLADVDVSFKSQFNLKSPIWLDPAEVKITGPSAVIDTIQQLHTEAESFSELDETVEKYLDVIHPTKTSVSPDKVVITIEVEKYTEKVLRIPVLIRNKPDDVNIKLFPSEVKVSCQVGMSEFEDLTANDFSAYVDYDDVNTNSTTLHVSIERKSSYIQVVSTTPDAVEYLIETD